MWRRDDVVDATPLDSTEVVYDYLELLLDELDRRGLDYTPAVVQQEADLEFPADVKGPTPQLRAGRRSGLRGAPDDARRDPGQGRRQGQERPGSGNYSSNVFVNTGAFGTVTVVRGFTWADVQIDKKKAKGTKFRFVNTHLESFNAYFRNAQAAELRRR